MHYRVVDEPERGIALVIVGITVAYKRPHDGRRESGVDQEDKDELPLP